MPALVAGIHDFVRKQDVDGRDKPGHDGPTFLLQKVKRIKNRGSY
jgi:hypothetical protein